MSVSGNSKKLKQKLICAHAVMFVMFAALSTVARAEDVSATPQTINVKLEPAALCEIVKQRHVMGIAYYYDPDGAPIRVFNPYGVGFTRKQNVLLFGRQQDGYSKSAKAGTGEIPGWRNFRLDKIKTAVARTDSFVPIPAPSDEYRAVNNFICKIDKAFGG